MADTTDTKTTLNPGVGGDVMGESAAVQKDGDTETNVKHPRVALALAERNIPRLVSRDTPLPVGGDEVVRNLERIAIATEEIRDLLKLILST